MSIQGSAGIPAHTLSRPVSEIPADTTVQRPSPAGAPVLTAEGTLAPERRAELERAVEQFNKDPEMKQYDLKFEIVDKNRIVVRIVDTNTGEILRQIPPEDLLRGFRQMDVITGIRVDSRV